MGHTPSTAGTFRKKFRKNSGKTPETLSERFLEFPSRVRLGCPKPYNSRHLRLPERFQNSLPPQYGWDVSFFRIGSGEGPLRAGHGIPSSTGGISDHWEPEKGVYKEGGGQKTYLCRAFSRIKRCLGYRGTIAPVVVVSLYVMQPQSVKRNLTCIATTEESNSKTLLCKALHYRIRS